ncbi:uncharacterized protein LY79DRAFT_587777 [Colletotrichum navitas]|uniref:Chromo domain-containing protein n=1 Tax=Colletotrichum navitas TaxID=681940 RepID=A0AAD8VA07_9PEZI|nr:uncharacterized protein LY79DRAFT_587777 [Colletotrichum navitas]KAK1596960.1 hypothetical protein LY79DRAFT_587777 [Colletotrichum navitas]
MNSALQERHVKQGWRYDEPLVNNTFLEIAFADSSRRCPNTVWPNDYTFQLVNPPTGSNTSSVAVNTDLAKLAKRYNIDINKLHSFMRFPPVRAVIRTLLIELERAEAQPGPLLDEDGTINSVSEMILNTRANFADRALVVCLIKLYSHFESRACWDFGFCDTRSVTKVLVAVVGLFCNAWVHAPSIDESWNRLSTPSPPPFVSHGPIDAAVSPLSQDLTPEAWFEWSLLHDPWIRRTNAAQVLCPDEGEDDNATIPTLIAEVSQPEPEKEGRVVVKYNKKPDEERWAFRAILDSRWAGKTPRTRLEYLIDWEYAEPTWQPARDLSGCDRAGSAANVQDCLLRYHGCKGGQAPDHGCPREICPKHTYQFSPVRSTQLPT